jgi:hypothetical protein
VFGVSQKSPSPHHLDFSHRDLPDTRLSFNVTAVRNETRVIDNTYGTAYTGMFNKERTVAFENGMETQLSALFLRNIRNRDLPEATLVMHFFRLDEEITPSSERRRLQMQASLEVENADGTFTTYGPVEGTELRSGMDVTAGHETAIVKKLATMVRELDDLVRTRTVATPVDETTFTPMPPGLGNGAYHSILDFRAGEVDTRVQAALFRKEDIATYKGHTHQVVGLRPIMSTRGRELRRVWGYHYLGRSYLNLNGEFYELSVDEHGQVFVVIPEGITDTQAMTERVITAGAVGGLIGGVIMAATSPGNQEGTVAYEVDLRTGELAEESPRFLPPEREQIGIIFHHDSPLNAQAVKLSTPEGEVTVEPGEYVLLDHDQKVTVSVVGNSRERRTTMFRRSGKSYPNYYVAKVDARRRLELEWLSYNEARDACAKVKAGYWAPAR